MFYLLYEKPDIGCEQNLPAFIVEKKKKKDTEYTCGNPFLPENFSYT